MNITKNQIEQYREDGYMILESVIPDEHLKLLRDLCQYFIDEMDARMDREGTQVCIVPEHRSSLVMGVR